MSDASEEVVRVQCAFGNTSSTHVTGEVPVEAGTSSDPETIEEVNNLVSQARNFI